MDNEIPHILIVDDDANLLSTMSDILRLKGFEPVVAQTGAAALVQLEGHRFDLALIDLRLGDMSGLLILRAIKTHSPETECILLTGHASQNSAIEAIQMGVYGYFQKPFDMEQVLLSIQRALEKKQSAQALHDSEQRFRALIENGRDNISLLAADGTLLWESPSTKSTLGYAPNQFVGRTLFELLHPDDQGRIQDLYAQIVQTPGKSRDDIFRLRHGDGTWRWIESTATNMLNEPSVLAIVINYRDISERIQAEEKVAQTE
jgi:PAS domain S-box-containing protein